MAIFGSFSLPKQAFAIRVALGIFNTQDAKFRQKHKHLAQHTDLSLSLSEFDFVWIIFSNLWNFEEFEELNSQTSGILQQFFSHTSSENLKIFCSNFFQRHWRIKFSNFWNFQRIFFSYKHSSETLKILFLYFFLRLWRIWISQLVRFWEKHFKLMKFLGIVFYTSYETLKIFFWNFRNFWKYLLLKLLKLWTNFWNQSSETLKNFFLKFLNLHNMQFSLLSHTLNLFIFNYFFSSVCVKPMRT